MNTNEELRRQMWELAYGLLAPEEVASLHAQIKSDPAAARLYAEVRLQADLVADAAKVSDPSVQFHADGEPAIIRPSPARRGASSAAAVGKSSAKGGNWLVGVAGTALAALLCFVLFQPSPSGEQLAKRFIATSVEAPARLQAGVSQQVSVYTTDVDQIGKPAEVEVRLVDASGEERLRRSVRTDHRGRGSVELPAESLEGHVRLEVTAQAEGVAAADGQRDTVAPLVIDAEAVPEPVETYVILDKPMYQAGETVNFALRKVTRFSKQLVDEHSASGEGERLVDEKMNHFLEDTTAQQGIVSGQFELPGADALTRLFPDGQRELGRSGGDRESEEQQLYFFDQVASALPHLSKQHAGPEDVAAATRFGNVERKSMDDARGVLLAETRSGKLDGRADPLAADKSKADAGLLREADDALPKSFAAAAGSSPGEVVASHRVVAAGKPLPVNLPAQVGRDLLLTAQCGDRLIASKEVNVAAVLDTGNSEEAQGGSAARGATAPQQQLPTVALNPPPEVDGEILVSIFDNQQQPPQLVDQQYFFRQPQEHLEIRLQGLKKRYTPGERVQLQVQVLDEQSRPVDATLAVRVWNEKLVQAAQTPVADLASTVFSGKVGPTRRDTALGISALAYGADRLRGMGGQAAHRGAADSDGAALGGPDPSGALALASPLDVLQDVAEHDGLLGAAQTARIEASNFGDVKVAYETAVAQARQQTAERKATIGRLLLLGGLALVVLLGMQALLRASAKTSIWLPSVAVALASLVIGAVWLNPTIPTSEVVQTASVPEEKREKDPAAGRDTTDISNDAPMPSQTEVTDEVADRERPLAQKPASAPAADATGSSHRQNSPAAELTEKKEVRRYDFQEFQAPLGDAPAPPPAPTAPPPSVAFAPPANMPADSATVRSRSRLKSAAPTNDPSPAERAEVAETPPAADAPPARRLSDATESRTPSEPSAGAKSRSSTAAARPSAENARDAESKFAENNRPAPAASSPAPKQSLELRGGVAGKDDLAKEVELDRYAGQKLAKKVPEAAAGSRSPDRASGQESLERNEPADNGNEFRRDRSMSLSESVGDSDTQGVAPPSLLFEPALSTNSEGQAAVEFTLPEVDCEYRVLIDAIGHGRIGSLQQVIVGQGDATSDE